MTKSKETYFHGFPLSDFLTSDVFLRIEDWLKSGLCYELSALAMLLLRFNHTARLCRGTFTCDGHLSRHSWVEFRVPFNGWFVMDFAWLYPSVIRKGAYQKIAKIDVNCKWTCDYTDFWSLDFAKILHDFMRNPSTSNILVDLGCFVDPSEGFGFHQACFQNGLSFADGGKNMPVLCGKEEKGLSTLIIRDFIRKPGRLQPKAKTVRRMKSEMKKM